MFVCVDYSFSKEYYFTNPQTWILWAIVDLHDYLMYFLLNVFIIVIVFTIICLFFQQTWFKLGGLKFKWWKSKSYEKENYIQKNKYVVFLYNKYKLYSFNHAPLLEFFWTITPTIMLIFMGWPSFKVLYAMEQLIDPIHTIIIIGNQWYWSYNYSDYDIVSDIIQQLDSNGLMNLYIDDVFFDNSFLIEKENVDKKKLLHSMSKYLRKFEESKIMYDCVIISDEDLPIGYPRLLSTDQVLVLPTYVSIRLLVTSVDVIHSWALPSHGIKMDAIPGRVNQINFLAQTVGTYWGQCSELCGINHGFMPIEVRVLPLDDYLAYISLNISFRQDKLLAVVEKFFEAFIIREDKKLEEKIIIDSIENNLSTFYYKEKLVEKSLEDAWINGFYINYYSEENIRKITEILPALKELYSFCITSSNDFKPLKNSFKIIVNCKDFRQYFDKILHTSDDKYWFPKLVTVYNIKTLTSNYTYDPRVIDEDTFRLQINTFKALERLLYSKDLEESAKLNQ